MKKAAIICVGLLLGYIAVELLSFAILAGVNHARPDAFAASVDEILAGLESDDLRAYLQQDYDPVLGWDNKPGTAKTEKNCMGEPWSESFGPDGARSAPSEFATTLIASYGDSYLKGGEVNDDQTWQYQLSRQLNQGVKNYAVGAYGTYQALLKARLHIEAGEVYPVTLLGVNEQNIKRVVNLYRPFMYRAVSAKFSFKPGLACRNDHCQPVENLLTPDIHSIDQVRRIAQQARALDYWARHRPTFEYPWSVNLFKLTKLAIAHVTQDEREPLWHSPEGTAAMRLIVGDFRNLVKTAGSLPVLLFIPESTAGGSQPSYREFKREIAEEYPDVVVLDVADTEFDRKRFRLKPTNCHPSEYGHSIIAKTVYEGLAGRLPNPTARP